MMMHLFRSMVNISNNLKHRASPLLLRRNFKYILFLLFLVIHSIFCKCFLTDLLARSEKQNIVICEMLYLAPVYVCICVVDVSETVWCSHLCHCTWHLYTEIGHTDASTLFFSRTLIFTVLVLLLFQPVLSGVILRVILIMEVQYDFFFLTRS